MTTDSTDRFQSFEEFWPYYLEEHSNPLCRVLHFVGTTGALTLAGIAAVTLNPFLLPAALVCGYGFAWIGHFFIEKNRPATFKYPLWSLRGDFKLYGQMLRGKFWTGSPALAG